MHPNQRNATVKEFTDTLCTLGHFMNIQRNVKYRTPGAVGSHNDAIPLLSLLPRLLLGRTLLLPDLGPGFRRTRTSARAGSSSRAGSSRAGSTSTHLLPTHTLNNTQRLRSNTRGLLPSQLPSHQLRRHNDRKRTIRTDIRPTQPLRKFRHVQTKPPTPTPITVSWSRTRSSRPRPS